MHLHQLWEKQFATLKTLTTEHRFIKTPGSIRDSLEATFILVLASQFTAYGHRTCNRWYHRKIREYLESTRAADVACMRKAS